MEQVCNQTVLTLRSPDVHRVLISLVLVLIIVSQNSPEGAFLFCPSLMRTLGCTCCSNEKGRNVLIYFEWQLGRPITITIMGSVICQCIQQEKDKM